MVDTSVTRAPRVYVRFDILRNGAIDPNSIRLERPSGITSLDNSARRAVFAASPLPPLPDAYRGSRVSVQFWFEYTR
jgi:TonB family protein